MFGSVYPLELFPQENLHVRKQNSHSRSHSFSHHSNSHHRNCNFNFYNQGDKKISTSVQSNLKYLTEILNINDPSSMSLSLSGDQFGEDYIEEGNNYGDRKQALYRPIRQKTKYQYFEIIQNLLKNPRNAFESIIHYNKLFTFKASPTQQMLNSTLFSSETHGIITCYLEQRTQFYQINRCNQKILDIFYKYVFCEYGYLMEQNLRDHNFSSLGKWFYQEGLLNFFKKYYTNAQEFTLFFMQFMKYGIAAIFLAAVNILERKFYVCQENQQFQKQIEIIKTAYINKYGIK